jgi:hypothetical protein
MSTSHRDEIERPAEWLRCLDEQDGSYARLLHESGNLALAAHRLARAKRRVLGGSDGVPTLREVIAAARTIADRVPDHPDWPSRGAFSADVRGLCMSEPPAGLRN